MLSYYQLQTTQLLANPAAPTALYATSDIVGWINTARYQLAGESGCIRATGRLVLAAGVTSYPFASITNLPAGVQGVFAVRQGTIASASGAVYVGSRSYPWAMLYWNSAFPTRSMPTEWAQYGIGVAGSLVVNSPPDTAYTMNLDCTCEPVPLITDTTVEAIPYPYQDCVPYYAAYLAYMSSQRQSDADKMYARYKEWLNRARKISVPNVLGGQYDQAQIAPTTPAQAPGGQQ